MTRWLTEPEQRAWRGLLQMTAQLQARLHRQLASGSGLSLADYDVLVPLSETPAGRLRMFELAAHLNWEQSRVSHHLARMQRRGLIGREDCVDDRRGAFVVLTDAGRTAIEQAAPGHVDAVRRLVFDGLTPEQVAALQALADGVLARLTAERGRATEEGERATERPAPTETSSPGPFRDYPPRCAVVTQHGDG